MLLQLLPFFSKEPRTCMSIVRGMRQMVGNVDSLMSRNPSCSLHESSEVVPGGSAAASSARPTSTSGPALGSQQATRAVSTSGPITAAYGNRQQQEGKSQWQALAALSKEKINPCNSPLHPAVVQGIIQVQPGDELCVQQAYTPESTCFGCGPAHQDGLHLQSRRVPDGLEAVISIPAKYCAFPGIINGGIITSVLDCHGNWTAAIALMDRACLSKPPLTLTSSLHITYKEPTPPDTELLVRSVVTGLKESSMPGAGRSTVEVEISIYSREAGVPKLLVVAQGVFKKLGALRAL